MHSETCGSITIVSEARALTLTTKTVVASPSPKVLSIKEGISVHPVTQSTQKAVLGSFPHPKNATMFRASAKSLVLH